MPIKAGPGEQYTIRRKVLKIFGASFHVFDAQGDLVAYCHQKAFRLREDIRLYADEQQSKELLTLAARSILDFSTTYDVRLASGESLGSLRRKGFKSSLVRDEWLVFDADDRPIGHIREKNATLAMARRWVEGASIIPQTYQLFRAGDDAHLATFRQHFNPFIYKLGVAIHLDDEHFDDLIVLASASLIAAIEGRQD